MIETFYKDPDDVLDYQIDWALWLDDDTIATSIWDVPVGITEDSETQNTTTATVWISGGTLGAYYIITNRITTAGGRQKDRSLRIVVRVE